MNEDIKKAIELAKNASYEDEVQEAYDILSDLNKRNPDDLVVKTELGIILSKLQRDRRAETILRDVLANDPDNERATSALGYLLDNSLRSEEAEKLYRNYLSSNQDSHAVTENLCRLLESEDRIDESIELSQTHAKKFPHDLESYIPLRVILHQIELRLEDTVIEDEFSVDSQLQLLENYLEQFEIYLKILKNVVSMSVDDTKCLHDDILRVYGEANQLYTLLTNHKKVKSSLIQKRFDKAREFMELEFSQ